MTSKWGNSHFVRIPAKSVHNFSLVLFGLPEVDQSLLIYPLVSWPSYGHTLPRYLTELINTRSKLLIIFVPCPAAVQCTCYFLCTPRDDYYFQIFSLLIYWREMEYNKKGTEFVCISFLFWVYLWSWAFRWVYRTQLFKDNVFMFVTFVNMCSKISFMWINGGMNALKRPVLGEKKAPSPFLSASILCRVMTLGAISSNTTFNPSICLQQC